MEEARTSTQAEESTLLADERRAQILEAAISCMARKGYERTTMDDIAQESGLSKGALYWYFRSKRDIFFAGMQELLGLMVAHVQAIVSDVGSSSADKLTGMISQSSEFWDDERDLVNVFIEFYSQSRNDKEILTVFRDLYETMLQGMQGVVDEGIAAGEFRDVPAREVSQFLLGTWEGLFFHLMLGVDIDWGRMAEVMQMLLARGIRKDGDR
jgi:AcrR family transcriptional regulator